MSETNVNNNAEPPPPEPPPPLQAASPGLPPNHPISDNIAALVGHDVIVLSLHAMYRGRLREAGEEVVLDDAATIGITASSADCGRLLWEACVLVISLDTQVVVGGPALIREGSCEMNPLQALIRAAVTGTAVYDSTGREHWVRMSNNLARPGSVRTRPFSTEWAPYTAAHLDYEIYTHRERNPVGNGTISNEPTP